MSEKTRVTLTLMPAPMVSAIADSPSSVAGILIIALGSPTRSHMIFAAVAVPAVSRASGGGTSIETRPSAPSVAS
ncbi:Uncharacterised protein [Mycobacteroides abscessus subsp. abscessus]|nr:Uncharacterised protein [Mycobacteroides abscessus subsp. abscessus]